MVNKFVNKVTTSPYLENPYSCEYKVNQLIGKIQKSDAKCIAVYEDARVAAASAAVIKLNLPLQVIPKLMPNTNHKKLTLPAK